MDEIGKRSPGYSVTPQFGLVEFGFRGLRYAERGVLAHPVSCIVLARGDTVKPIPCILCIVSNVKIHSEIAIGHRCVLGGIKTEEKDYGVPDSAAEDERGEGREVHMMKHVSSVNTPPQFRLRRPSVCTAGPRR